MNNLVHSLPRLLLVAAFVAGLWIVGSYLIYESVGELRFALGLQRRIEAEIAQNMPDNLKNPGQRQQILRNINYGKLLIGAILTGSVLMVLAGFVILFWPGRSRVERFFALRTSRVAHRNESDLRPLQV
jgi:hypothetical protein